MKWQFQTYIKRLHEAIQWRVPGEEKTPEEIQNTSQNGQHNGCDQTKRVKEATEGQSIGNTTDKTQVDVQIEDLACWVVELGPKVQFLQGNPRNGGKPLPGRYRGRRTIPRAGQCKKRKPSTSPKSLREMFQRGGTQEQPSQS